MTEIQALLIGVIVGVPVQMAASVLRYNGKWTEMTLGKKLAMSMTGGIAAFVIGLWYLTDHKIVPGERTLYSLWLYQTVAAWGGAIVLDVMSQAGLETIKKLRGHDVKDGDEK